MLQRIGFLAILAVGVITLLPPRIAAQDQPSLYDRLGGQAAIEAVVDEGIKNVLADNRINQRFANADGERIRTLLIELMCQVTGGPCTYTGRPLKDAHMGMGITDVEFNALVGDLGRAMDTLRVPAKEKTELLELLRGTASDIVEVTSTPTPTPTATATSKPQAPPEATAVPARPTTAPTAAPAKPEPTKPGRVRYGPLGF